MHIHVVKFYSVFEMYGRYLMKGYRLFDLWKMLLIKLECHNVNFIKVKGHADNEYNNRCDEVARGEIKKAAAAGTSRDL